MSLEFYTDFSENTDLTEIGFSGGGWTVTASVGRFSSSAMRSSQNADRLVALSGNNVTTIVNLAFNMSTNINSTGANIIGFALYDSGTSQVGLTIDSSGHIVIGRGASASGAGTVLATSTQTITAGVQNHIEFKATINNTTGTVEVWLNGVQIINISSQNTRSSANNYANGVKFYHGNAGTGNGQVDISQLVIMNTSGSFMNALIGDIRLVSNVPTGDSAVEQFARSTGTDSFALVDETPPNDDTDYISDSVSGNKTRFTFPAISPSPATIHAVCEKTFVRKTDAGAITFKHTLNSNSVDSDGSAIAPSTTYEHKFEAWYQNPDGSVAWTESTLNAAEIGVKIT